MCCYGFSLDLDFFSLIYCISLHIRRYMPMEEQILSIRDAGSLWTASAEQSGDGALARLGSSGSQ
jgi:hypothetical protein